jgi:hypothetical protein
VRHSSEGYWIDDLGSPNGTSVNGTRIKQSLLRDGDLLSLGQSQLRYVAGKPPMPWAEDAPSEPARPAGPSSARLDVPTRRTLRDCAIAAAAGSAVWLGMNTALRWAAMR